MAGSASDALQTTGCSHSLHQESWQAPREEKTEEDEEREMHGGKIFWVS